MLPQETVAHIPPYMSGVDDRYTVLGFHRNHIFVVLELELVRELMPVRTFTVNVGVDEKHPHAYCFSEFSRA